MPSDPIPIYSNFDITLYMLSNFPCSSVADYFRNQLFLKHFSGIQTKCQIVLTWIRLDVLSSLILIQTVCNRRHVQTKNQCVSSSFDDNTLLQILINVTGAKQPYKYNTIYQRCTNCGELSSSHTVLAYRAYCVLPIKAYIMGV